MIKLVVFKVYGEEDCYGASAFFKSGKSLQKIYNEMIKKGDTEYDSSNDDWTISLEKEIVCSSIEQAQEIGQLLMEIADDDWLGDYDKRKHCDITSIIIEEY